MPAPNSRRRTALAALLPVLLLVVTACSGGEEPEEESSPTPSTATTTQAPPDDAETTSATPPDDSGTTSAPGPPDDSASTSAPPADQTAAPEPTPAHAFGAYGVAAGHPKAVEIGMSILERGGNAVDAAVATAFAMGVIEPLSSGVGGGGAALVVPMPSSRAPGHPEEALSYDYREVLQSSGQIPKSRTGIPGFVAGMATLHAEHGQLPWRDVVQPAIDLAEFGVPTSWWVAQELRTERGRRVTEDLPQFRNQALQPLAKDDPLIQPDLADTLETIAREGRDGFYEGYLAEELVSVDGIDATGLGAYQVDVRAPARGAVGDHVVLAAAPGLAGVALVQLLQVAEANGLADKPAGGSAYIDTLTDAWLVADNSMDTVVGDPNFVDVPVNKLTDPKANADLEVAAPAPGGQVAAQPADGNTTHLSIVDGEGLAVSMTNTITDFWGSGQQVEGFFLNNHLVRFGTTGRTKANDPEPGKRPVSFMAPAVVLDSEQRPVLVVGSPGGRRIPNIEANVIARWLLRGDSLQAAVNAPRFHLDNGQLYAERLTWKVTHELEGAGYEITEAPAAWNLFGSVQALELDHAAPSVSGATDDRRTGAWDSGPGARP